jgi:hypothetical protein
MVIGKTYYKTSIEYFIINNPDLVFKYRIWDYDLTGVLHEEEKIVQYDCIEHRFHIIRNGNKLISDTLEFGHSSRFRKKNVRLLGFWKSDIKEKIKIDL